MICYARCLILPLALALALSLAVALTLTLALTLAQALDLLREMRPTMAAADFYMMALGRRALSLPLPLTLTPEP